ncbi:MAG: hypothetical protein WD097_00935 [Balneolales bacterium]
MKYKVMLLILGGILMLPLKHTQAQFRSDSESTLGRTGPIIRSTDSNDENALFGLHNFQMNHSYEMSLGSFSGNMYNMNTYTNTMQMMFNESLHGRVDLAVSHSPFGPGIMGQDNQTQFYVRNAELNYKFNKNTRIHLRFQQLPTGQGYGYYPSYFQRNRLHNSPYIW